MHGLLCLKEIEYFGVPQTGTWVDRQQNLVDCLLKDIETTWLGRTSQGAIIPRIKAIRTRIIPELLKPELTPQQRHEIWEQLSKIYLSQQVSSYPYDYLQQPTTESRLLETAERLHEDLTDSTKRVGPLKAIIQVGKAIEVPAERVRGDASTDVMVVLRTSLQSMLNELAGESKTFEDTISQ
jgi:hypothetical protein